MEQRPSPATDAPPPWMALLVLSISQFMVTVDVTVVTVAYPHIQQTFGIPPAQLQWVTTAYTLMFGGFLMLAGRAGDLLGKRNVFRFGLALFTLASVLCSVSQEGWQIFAARGIQGLGAALVVPSALSLLTTTYPEGAERNRAMAIWSAIASAGAVTGYALGGTITGLLDWRFVFVVNVPIGLFCLYRSRRLNQPARPEPRAKLDIAGATTLTLGLVLTVFAITSIADRGFAPLVVGSLAVGLALLVVFVFVERKTPEPLVRFGIFRNRNVVGGNLISVVNTAASAVVVFFTTLYLQEVVHLTPLQTGLSFAPITVIGALLARQTGTLMNRFGQRKLLVVGASAAALGALWLSQAPVNGSYFVNVLPGILLTSLGSMVAAAPSMIVATSRVADTEQGLASGLVSTSQQLGGALGLAVFATAAAATTSALGAHGLPDLLAGYHVGYYGSFALPLVTVLVSLTVVRMTSPATAAVPADAEEVA
jgi:EmrB/QacA subfamily drug resistance transporter